MWYLSLRFKMWRPGLYVVINVELGLRWVKGEDNHSRVRLEV